MREDEGKVIIIGAGAVCGDIVCPVRGGGRRREEEEAAREACGKRKRERERDRERKKGGEAIGAVAIEWGGGEGSALSVVRHRSLSSSWRGRTHMSAKKRRERKDVESDPLRRDATRRFRRRSSPLLSLHRGDGTRTPSLVGWAVWLSWTDVSVVVIHSEREARLSVELPI